MSSRAGHPPMSLPDRRLGPTRGGRRELRGRRSRPRAGSLAGRRTRSPAPRHRPGSTPSAHRQRRRPRSVRRFARSKEHSSDIGRRGSPAFRTAGANARRWIHSGRSPHQSGVETSYFGQSIQLETTGIPGFEQSLLERCAAIGVWLESGQALGRDAGAEKQFHASSSRVGRKISEASRGPGPPKKPRMQFARRAGLCTHPCDWRDAEYRRG